MFIQITLFHQAMILYLERYATLSWFFPFSFVIKFLSFNTLKLYVPIHGNASHIPYLYLDIVKYDKIECLWLLLKLESY